MNRHILSNLKQRRKELGISQKELAYTVGITQPTLSKLERGDIQLTVELYRKLSKVLRLSDEFIEPNTDVSNFGFETQRLMERYSTRMMSQDLLDLTLQAEGAQYFQETGNRIILLSYRAIALIGLNRLFEARELVEQLMMEEPYVTHYLTRARIWKALGGVALSEENFLEAANACRKAYDLCISKGDMATDEEMYRQVCHSLCSAYIGLQRYDEAQVYLLRAQEVEESHRDSAVKRSGDLHFYKGVLAHYRSHYTRALEEYHEALEHYEFVLNRNAESVVAMTAKIVTCNNIAYTHKVLGNDQLAERYYLQTCELAKSNPKALTPEVRRELANEGYLV